MNEFTNDPFYELIAEYPDCAVDYCIVRTETPCRGLESHREALHFAMQKLARCSAEECGFELQYDMSIAAAKQIDAAAFLSLPDKTWKTTITLSNGTKATGYSIRTTNGGVIPYWQAFLLPPCGPEYAPEDFVKVNRVLFPHGADGLTVYEWTTGWSNYFDDGREWWGVLCVSAYDRNLRRFVVIMASATD